MDDLPPGFRVVQQSGSDDLPPGFRVVQPAAPAGPSLMERAGAAVQAVENRLLPTAQPETRTPASTASTEAPGLMSRIMGGARTAIDTSNQALRGLARGTASVAGLPVDAMTFALNNDSDVQNILGLIGLGGRKIENPVFGSDYNKRAVDSAMDAGTATANLTGAGLRPPSAGPQNLFERGISRVGEEVGAMALPVGGAIRAGATMAPEAIQGLPRIARAFVEPASIDAAKFAQREVGTAVGAGLGASGVNEVTRAGGVKEDSIGHAVGDIAGALGGAGAVGVARHIGPKIADVFNALRGDPNFANQVSKDAAVERISEAYGLPTARLGESGPTNTAPIVDAIENGTRISDTVPGFRESLADRTGNSGIAGLEYSRQASGSGAFAERTRTNIKAVDDAMQRVAPQGTPGAFRGALEERRAGVLQGADDAATTAQQQFEEAAGRLRSSMHADARGADIRAPLEDALGAARNVEREAWQGIDGQLPAAPLAQRFARVTDGMTESERRVVGDLTGALGTPGRLAPRAPVPDAMSAITGRAPPAAAADAADLREITSLRSELTTAQRQAATQGDGNKARLVGNYIDQIDAHLVEHAPGQQAAIDAARTVSRDLNDRFTRPQTAIAQTLDRQQGLPRVPDSGVPGRFVQPDSGRVADFDALMREAGTDPRAQGAIRDEILARVERQRTPEQLDRFVTEHSRVLDRFPDLREEINGMRDLRAGADTAASTQSELRSSLGDASTPGTSSVGRYLRYGDEQSTTAMRGVMNAPKPAKAADELLNFAGNGKEAVEGARRTFWDILESQGRSKGETTANIDGVQPWMPRRVARFLEDPRNKAVAERLYRDDPEHLRNIGKITDALQNVDTRLRARATGSSGTAQGVSQVLSPETLQSRLYAYKRGQVSGTFLITSIAAVAGRRGVARAQTEAIGRLVDEALTNPDAAATLLRENNPANRAILARKAKGWIGNEAGTAIDALNDADEDPTMSAVKRKAAAR